MTDREKQIAAFIAQTEWAGAARTSLAGDASFRRYERLQETGRSAILMDAPPETEDVGPFISIAEHLSSLGYSAPKILAADRAQGFLLLEDLGDDRFSRVLTAMPDMEQTLYEQAVDLLSDMHGRNPPDHLLPPYDETLLATELALFLEWYLPQLGDVIDRGVFLALWQPFLRMVQSETPVLVLRDYHADNLMWLPQRKSLKKIGLLDFQDAVSGHPAYDLVSLLQDARRDVPEELEEKMITRYLQSSPLEEGTFRKAYAILGAQRNTKIIGIFTRLWQRDGKPLYLPLIPRVWGLLERNLRHPGLSDLKQAFDRMVPEDLRDLVFTP